MECECEVDGVVGGVACDHGRHGSPVYQNLKSADCGDGRHGNRNVGESRGSAQARRGEVDRSGGAGYV